MLVIDRVVLYRFEQRERARSIGSTNTPFEPSDKHDTADNMALHVADVRKHVGGRDEPGFAVLAGPARRSPMKSRP